jgi:hypothetical protein
VENLVQAHHNCTYYVDMYCSPTYELTLSYESWQRNTPDSEASPNVLRCGTGISTSDGSKIVRLQIVAQLEGHGVRLWCGAVVES